MSESPSGPDTVSLTTILDRAFPFMLGQLCSRPLSQVLGRACRIFLGPFRALFVAAPSAGHILAQSVRGLSHCRCKIFRCVGEGVG